LAMEKFIFSYAVFLFFISQIVALGSPFIADIDLEPPSIPEQPTVWDYVSYPISNIGFFFNLMLASPTVGFIGAVVFTPAIIVLIYGLLKLLRGGG